MRSSRLGRVGAFLLLTGVFAFAGCSDQSTAEVSGMVRVDGNPVETGSIMFVPADGIGSTAGGEIKDGKYSVRVPVGKMKVSISSPKLVRMKKLYNTPDSPEMPWNEEALPKRYNEQTELELDVTPGSNKKDWDLQGK
jgi:hypothetical protein